MNENEAKANKQELVFSVANKINTTTVLFETNPVENGFKVVKPNDMMYVFDLISKQWMLITAEDGDKINTMTASWGGLGYFWKKNIAVCGIRHSRYTFEISEKADTFSLSFFDECYRDKLAYCGKASGRDENKIEKCGFTIGHSYDTPYIEQASLVLICKKLYADDIKPENFIDKTIDGEMYPTKDYHKIYTSEILKVLIK